MKIKQIDLYQTELPYSGGVYRLSAGREYHSFRASVVRITSDEGLSGWGESTPFGSNYIAAHARGVRAGVEEIAPALIGLDPRKVDRITDAMDSALLGHLHAKTPIDVACWDLFGQSVGLPVCELLGGSTGDLLPVISSIHVGTPEDMRERVRDYRARGFRGHSIKIGAEDIEGGAALDVARVQAVLADRQPGEFYLLDANGGLIPETALRLLRQLPSDADIVIEAPCASWRETLSLRRRCSVPIILDELVQTDEDVLRLITEDAADGIGLKISKCGGLTHGRRHRDFCQSAGLTMSVQDTVGSSIAFAGILHLGQSVPQRLLRCVLDCRAMVASDLAQLDATIVDGGVRAPQRPGLGLDVDLAALGDPVASWD